MSKISNCAWGMGLAALGVVLCAAAPAPAAISLVLQPTGTGEWDWTLTGALWKFNDGTNPAPYNTKYSTWFGDSWYPSANHCVELETRPGLATSNPDTRLWIRTSGSVQSPGVPSTYPGKSQLDGYTAVNDDFGGTLQSKMRLWIERAGGNAAHYFMRIAAYNSSHNNEDFRVKLTRLDISKTACTSGQTTIPWAQVVQGSGIETITLSTF